MPLKIAILGWGSLIWDARPEFDKYHGPWRFDGPELKLEFSRVSKTRRGALTLVIDHVNGEMCRVAYAISKRSDPDDAIYDLRSRESTTLENIGFAFIDGSRKQGRNHGSLDTIVTWAMAMKFDVIIWTDLESNFQKVCGIQFGIDAALYHLRALDPDAKSIAAEYVWRASEFVQTSLRRKLQAEPWFQR